MSVPIKYCQIVNSFDNDGGRKAIKLLRYNISHGAFTLRYCKHKPRCRKLTEEEDKKMIEGLRNVVRKKK